MDITVKIDPLAKNVSVFELTYALLETGDANLIVSLIKNVKSENKKYITDEIFKNAKSALKAEMASLLKSTDLSAYNLTEEPQHTFAFSKRNYEVADSKTISLEGNTFAHLQKAILKNFNATEILEFVRVYKVNSKAFLEKLENCGEVFAKAFKRDVLKDDAYHKDEMQLYM